MSDTPHRPWIPTPPPGLEPPSDQGQFAIDTAIGFICGELGKDEWAAKRAAIMNALDDNVPPSASVVANGVTVRMVVKTDLGDEEYVLLEAVNGDLTGEEPGMYYPVPHAVV